MKSYIAGTESKQGINEMIADACKDMIEELKPLAVKMSGSFDATANKLHIIAKTVDGKEANDALFTMFYDIFFYLPIEIKGKKYIFDLYTYTDPTYSKKAHHFHLETSLELMPDTGGFTESQWEKYGSQLVYTKDGKSQDLEAPDMFLDEE